MGYSAYMKVLITGGCSELGISLSDWLISTGNAVTIFDQRKPSSAKYIDCIQGDIRDFAAVSSAAKGCDAGIHLAALSGDANHSDILSVNVIGVCSYLLAARKAEFRNSIIASSAPVHLTEQEAQDSFPLRFEDGKDQLYDLTKTIQESIGREFHLHGIPVLCLRFGHIVLGEKRMNLKGTVPLENERYCRGGWVALEDIVSACSAALGIEPSAEMFENLNIVGSRDARAKYNVAHAEERLGITLQYDFAAYV